MSKAVRTTVLPEVAAEVALVDIDINSVQEYSTAIRDWLRPIISLDDFFVYPMNGITEGLNYWMSMETRSIHMAEGDYQWVQPTKGTGDILYMSNPSAIDGNWKEIPNHMPVALDLAYVGSTDIKHIDLPSNVEYVFFSLSKAFGIRNVRTGWLFSRKAIPRLEALIYSAKYYNYTAHHVAENLIEQFDIDYVYNRLKDKQAEYCAAHNLTPSDSVHIATSTDEQYKELRRVNDLARICINYEEA